MQNKRINSEIASVEASIHNFEDTKKFHVSKKQFKEAQTANNEIKKCMENKNQLNELLKGNNVEIETLNNDNKESNETINKYKEEIKNCEDENKKDNLGKTINDINDKNKLFLLKTYLQKWLNNSNKLNEIINDEVSSIQRAFKIYKANKTL